MAETQAKKSILLFGCTISLSECDTATETNTSIPTSGAPNNPSNSIRPLDSSITTDDEKTNPKKRPLDHLTSTHDHELHRGSKKPRTPRVPVVHQNINEAPRVVQNAGVDVREQQLREFITTEMKGSDFQQILERELTTTDLSDHHGHLAIPKKQIKKQFLTAEEELRIQNKESLNVKAIDPDFKPWNLKLGRWNYDNKLAYKYVVKGRWNKFKNANPNTLQVSALIRVYSFRIQQTLGFAFLIV